MDKHDIAKTLLERIQFGTPEPEEEDGVDRLITILLKHPEYPQMGAYNKVVQKIKNGPARIRTPISAPIRIN